MKNPERCLYNGYLNVILRMLLALALYTSRPPSFAVLTPVHASWITSKFMQPRVVQGLLPLVCGQNETAEAGRLI